MHWEIIKKAEIESWNEKLKQTDASSFQYPYYLTGEYSSSFYNSLFIRYMHGDKELAYAGIVEIGIFPFKVGVIDDGPVILEENFDLQMMLENLKKFSEKKRYMHLQIRPVDDAFENLLKNDAKFEDELFFPFHRKEDAEWNIYNQPEDKLLASFKVQCRRKIVLAGRVPFEFIKLTSESHLRDVKNLFQKAGKTKGYKYISFPALLRTYKNGKKYNLCDLYGVYLNNELINAVLIIKDARSFFHFTSAMLVKGYKQNESPPAKLHLFIMQDCFYNEHKSFYNISYGGTDNLVRFKEYFNPVEIKKPPYYTFIIRKRAISFFQKTTPDKVVQIRAAIKNIRQQLNSSKATSLTFIFSALSFYL